MELQHSSHRHPLKLYDVRNNGGGGGAKGPCHGCVLPLSGVTYNCKQCKFFLHKVCAELPNKIIHFLHPKHPLTLCTKSPYGEQSICDNCDEKNWGFGYHCSVCQFDLDIKCVLLQQIVEHEDHKHSFKLLRQTSFTCDACGETSKDISCVCSTCHLLVHQSCASLPPTIKHEGHDHPLSLIQSIQLNDPMDNLCKVCSKDVDKCYWCYYCASCTYIAHLNCATSETKLGDGCNKLGSASVSNESTIDLLRKDVNKISLTKIECVPELQHFSHQQHSLTLSNDEPDSEEVCDGCVQIISAPFYKCAQCNFFLHVSCAKLPHKIQHLLHPHSLALFAIPNLDFGIIYCRVCFQYFNGFAYGCKNCDFYIDVRCSSVSDTLIHEAHEHTLSLDQKESESKCNACGFSCRTKFRCEACNFNLDLRCAALPSSARHEWDKHPLKLTFSIIEDKLGTYYCDFCEERKDDPTYWFYYCEDCDIAVHPSCLLGKHTMIKFGKSFKVNNHPHPLTSVKKTKRCRSSGHCSDHDKESILVLKCHDCDFHCHA